MAKRRSSSRRRRRRRFSRLPAILFAALVATGAGYLFVRASDDGTTGNAPSIGSDSLAPPVTDAGSSPNGTDGAVPSDSEPETETDTSSTDPSNLGKPVQVFSDTLGDLDIDQVIVDWTMVDRPKVPSKTAEVKLSSVSNGRITGNLPDGYYYGIPVSTFDEDVRGINFDIRQVFWGDECTKKFGVGDDICLNDYQVLDTTGSQLYPSFLGDLLFVSLAVYGDVYSESNTAVAPSTYWSLLAAGQPVTVTIPTGEPDPPNVAIADSPFLLTVVGGTIIAAEGIWIP